MRSLLAGTTRTDRTVAAVLVLAVGLDVAGNATEGTKVVALPLALAGTLPVLFRRVQPLRVGLAIAALVLVRALAGGIPDPTPSTLPLLALTVFSAAAFVPRARDAALVTLACLVATHVGIALTLPVTLLDVVIVSLLLGGAHVGGTLVGRRTAEARTLRERSRAEEEAREARAREAVTAERARIARELHDVLAHSVSIISVQAGAAERQALKDRERARAAVAQVRRTADEAEADLERLLDVLAGGAGQERQPGLAELRRLVDDARAAGLPVTLTLDEGLADIPDGLALAAYRIVQEGLTNVRKHAGDVPTDVVVRHVGGELRVEVANLPGEGPGGGTGLGLVGMGERVRVHGGRLRAGPDESGRWAVAASLPLEVP